MVLIVYDIDGLSASDTSGVSFCDFLVVSSDPDSNDAPVDSTLAAVRFHLSREIDAASLDDGTVLVSPEGGEPLAGSLNLETSDTVIAWTPDVPLRADTIYEIRLSSLVRATSGRRLDQDPCIPGPEPFLSHFKTSPRNDHRQEGRPIRR